MKKRMFAFVVTGWCAVTVLMLAMPALAHHSFAVFFDSERTVTISGVVQEFRFSNPHGLIRIAVKSADGKEAIWKAETNSPSILERRGWTRTSLKAGEMVTIAGWPARDGTNYLRMSSVKRADGTAVGGTAIQAVEEQK